MAQRGARFQRRHRLQGQFLLYGGRIDPGKGCEELLEDFTSYKEQAGDADLVLMGVKLMQLPEVPWVRFAGLLSERERLEALEAATIVVVPSPYESLSLLALEAMAVGTPVLCNGHSDVLVEHCRKSNAGLWYDNRDEFVDAAKLLLADDRLRRTMGRNGKEYVKREYRWDAILTKYDRSDCRRAPTLIGHIPIRRCATATAPTAAAPSGGRGISLRLTFAPRWRDVLPRRRKAPETSEDRQSSRCSEFAVARRHAHPTARWADGIPLGLHCATRTKPLARRPTGSRVIRSSVGRSVRHRR